jgi:hypothetical protein
MMDDDKYDTVLKPADPADIAAAIFDGPGEPDSALRFSPELAFLFNGSSEARKQGLHAIDLMMSGVQPDLALAVAFDNLREAAVNNLRKQLN